MTSPTIRPAQPSTTRPMEAQAAQPTTQPVSAENERDAAVADISIARANTRRPRTPSWTRAADQVARAYEDGGSSAVHALLRRSPETLRAIATGPADAIEDRMQDAVGYLDGQSALSAAGDFVDGAVRDAVATQAQRTIGGVIRRTEQMRNAILADPDTFRNAPANSPEGRVRDSLGLTSESSVAKINQAFDRTVEGLMGLSERFEGQAWEVGDFPTTARATLGRMRLRSHIGESTLAARAVLDVSGTAESKTTTLVDAAHISVGAVEIGHAVAHHAGAAMIALEVGILGAGLALGMAIHHGAEEVRNEALSLGHSIGL